MHDIRLIRDNPEAFDAGLARRGLPAQAASLIALDEARRAAVTEVQVAQSRRNEASKLIGAAMAKGDREGAEAIKAEVAALKDAMPAMEARAEELAGQQKAHAEAEVAMPPQAAEVRSAEAAATEAERALARLRATGVDDAKPKPVNKELALQ